MSQDEQRRGSGRRRRLRTRVAAVVAPICVVLGALPALGGLSGPTPAGATTAGAPLQVTIGTHPGDTATTEAAHSVLAGGDVTYEVTVTDTGTGPQSNVSVPVTLAPNFALHAPSINASNGSTSVAGGVLTWSVPTLAPGATETLTYTETVDTPSSIESDTTTASVTSDQSTSPVSASAGVGVVPESVVHVAVGDGVAAVAPGDPVVDTITVTNAGPSALSNATVTNAFTPDVGALGGGSSLADATFSDLGGGQGEWTGVNLASGASATFEVGATLPTSLTAGSALLDLATVLLPPDEAGAGPAPHATDADVVSGGAATGGLKLGITSFGGDGVTPPAVESALAGTDVTYQVSVTNDTAAAQTGVAVPVDLPPAFALSSALTTSAGSAHASGDVVDWTIPTVAAGATETLSYTETTDAPASTEAATTTASATSDQSVAAAVVSATVDVVPSAALSVSVSDGVDTVNPGSPVSYVVTLTNGGPSPATGASVTEALSGGFTASTAVSSVSGTSFADLGGSGFAWSGVDLPSGTSATFSLVGSVGTNVPAGGALVDVASADTSPAQVGSGPSPVAVDADQVVAAPQAISFAPPATGMVGTSATLSATGGGSGNPVVFSIDPSSGAGVCSVSGTNGTTVSFVAAGTCVVDADQGGNAGFAGAPTVTGTIAVEQAPAFTADTPPTNGTEGQPYAYLFAASGAPTPTFALAAAAPAWLALDPASGALSGTPPAGTTSFSYSVVATNAVGGVTAGPFDVAVAPATDPGEADVSLTLSCPATVAQHDVGTCSVSVRNAGPATAPSVTADVVLPFLLELESVPAGSTWSGNAGTWSLGDLGPGASAGFSLRFRAETPGSATVVSAVSSGEPDPTVANNAATASVAVTGDPTGWHRGHGWHGWHGWAATWTPAGVWCHHGESFA